MQNTVVTDIKKWDTVVNIEGVTKYFDQNRPVSLFKREKHRIYALKDVSFTLKKGELSKKHQFNRTRRTIDVSENANRSTRQITIKAL